MPKLIFVDSEGTEKSVEAENGLSVMEVARDNDLEIEGTCGGSISCCTCHVIIDKDWFSLSFLCFLLEKIGFPEVFCLIGKFGIP